MSLAAARALGVAWIALECLSPSSARAAGDAASTPASLAAQALAAGRDAAERGSFDAAATELARASELFARSGDAEAESGALLELAQAQQALGSHSEAVRSVERALALSRALDPSRRAAVLGALGGAELSLGLWQQADRHLREAAELAKGADAPAPIEAAVLSNRGALHALQGRHAEAESAFAESAARAEVAGDTAAAARSLANAARAAIAGGDPARGRSFADRAAERAASLESSHTKALLLISVALDYEEVGARTPDSPRALRRRAHALLTQALEVANEIGDARSASHALGHLGELYERDGRREEALDLTRRAIFQAQQVEAPESLYRWQGQAGRLLAALGREDEALQSYAGAIRTIEGMGTRIAQGRGLSGVSFRESIEPAYRGTVDLLLRRAEREEDAQRRAGLLLRARDTVELSRAAEMRDYFRDECVDAAREQLRSVEKVSPRAVMVYPILLDDRLALLVSSPSGEIAQYSAAVSRERLESEVRALRSLLVRRTTNQYLPHAQRLHAWLVAPFEPALEGAGIDTLVFVPDGLLRIIPMSALHDGSRFVIEKWAVAITPGVELTDPRPLDRSQLALLLGGLGESVDGLPALTHVPNELGSIQELLGGTVLLDGAFQRTAIREALGEEGFSVVHIATHGEFAEDFDQTWVLAHDGRLSGDQLAASIGLYRFRDRPLELLTLSACETARGSERAALGLLGIAVKAGARSALGTLWKVNDESTSRLMIEFYSQLRAGVSRAVALQRAQRALLADFRYRHPAYWSPFLLISSWL